MDRESFFAKRWVRWTAVFLVWTAVGLFFASQSSMWDRFLFRQQITWQRALATNLSFYYVWALLTPVVLWLAKRFRLEKNRWVKSLSVHIPLGLALAGGQLLIAEAVWRTFQDAPVSLYETFRSIEFSFAFYFNINLITYWAIVGFAYGIESYRKLRDRELRASQLEAQLTMAKLQALKMQLQPHFLFNTLNSISSLMHKSIADADRIVARLGDLLRYSLDTVGVQEVSLEEELDFARRYLEIEQVRFGSRLKVLIDADGCAMQAKVPNLILQPLVENAVRYGIASRASGGSIEILAKKEDNMLQLVVQDDGPGLSSDPGGRRAEGVGLNNTRSRLQQMYGEHHEFELVNRNGSGLAVRLKIPYNEEQVLDG